MKINILDNELVPEHIIISKEETEKILKNLKINIYQLPKILKSDPALVALDEEVQEGTLIKIIRKSTTAGDAVTYRVVV